MKKVLFCLSFVPFVFFMGCEPSGETPVQVEETSSSESLELVHLSTQEMPVGTHRPEILISEEGDIYLLVVQSAANPLNPEEQIKHQAYHYDEDWNLIGDPFPITYITEQYGDPADHRALLMDDVIVVVYQTNVFKDGQFPIGSTGPAEAYTENQSLMLAEFSLDGTELKRVPIVANAPTGEGENFPDHAMIWNGENLLITTGTGEQQLKIREVDLDGNILATYEYPVGFSYDIPNEIGNSLSFDTEGHLVLISGNGPNNTDSLSLTTFNQAFSILDSIQLPSSGREETFPTGNAWYNDFLLIGYISRETGGSAMDLNANPYSPYLKVLNAEGEVLIDVQVGEKGFAHVHPTLAVFGDRIFFVWSQSVNSTNQSLSTPQVVIEEYVLQ